MRILGVIRDGAVVLYGPIPLPDGTEVQIEPVPSPEANGAAGHPVPPVPSANGEPLKTFAEYFAEFHGKAVGLPEDFASQHEHYRYGTPKR